MALAQPSRLSRIRRKFKRIIILLLVLGLGVGAYAVFGNLSKGNRVGYILKASQRGYVFKTYEGEMNTGLITGNNNRGGVTPTVWNFSMANEAVYTQVQAAMEHDKKVKLYYKEKFIQFDVAGETNYIVYKVEELDEAVPAPPSSTTPL